MRDVRLHALEAIDAVSFRKVAAVAASIDTRYSSSPLSASRMARADVSQMAPTEEQAPGEPQHHLVVSDYLTREVLT